MSETEEKKTRKPRKKLTDEEKLERAQKKAEREERKKVREAKKLLKSQKTEGKQRKSNVYSEFVKSHYKTEAIQKIAPKERFKEIAKLWKEHKNK